MTMLLEAPVYAALPYQCEVCDRFRDMLKDGGGYICLNGHGPVAGFNNDEERDVFLAARRRHFFGDWIDSFTEATNCGSAWKLAGLRGVYKKLARPKDGEEIERDLFGGRVGDDVFRFRRESGCSFSEPGYRRLTALRGSDSCWRGNIFHDDAPYLADGVMALSWMHMGKESQENETLTRSAAKQMSREGSIKNWNLITPKGSDLDFVGWREEGGIRCLYIESDHGPFRFDADCAAWMRTVLAPDGFRVAMIRSANTGEPVAHLHFMRDGEVAGVLAQRA